MSKQQASPLAIVIAIVVLLLVLFVIYKLTFGTAAPQPSAGGPATGPAGPVGGPAAPAGAPGNQLPPAAPSGGGT